jgi:SAM-dependent methyltransferase
MRTVDLDRLGIGPGDCVLDVGCGEGRHMHAAASIEGADVVGVDLDTDRLHTAREDYEEYVDPEPDVALSVAVADALRLPFPDDAFDAVVCSEVLEHIPDYEAAIDEVVRVLAPGGRLGVSVPRRGPEQVCWALSEEYHRVDGGHVRIFRREELEGALVERDLDPEGSHFAHALHAPYWWLKCLWWERRDEDQPRVLELSERLLEYDLMERPHVTRAAETALNPLIGKSLVLYFRNPRTR